MHCTFIDLFKVNLLLKVPTLDINARSVDGAFPLAWACKSGSINMVQSLLNYGSSHKLCVNLQQDDGRTALMEASWEGNLEIAKLLLQQPEIDINLQC